mmetsp:Transcript_2032/g.3172  ORF Transcript_2032/g.3172 Transcript_2032/m.3172 type:complete len:580 (+) Transcript_2032:75-1814(+)
MADELKVKGNAAFSAKHYPEAIEFFTQAIAIDPSNHVLYSNRSAAEASLEDYEAAKASADKCVELKPEWAKGYSRLGAALHGLGEYDEAIQAYEGGLARDPDNEQLKSGLEDAQQAKSRPARGGGGGGGGMFGSPDVMSRLALDSRTRALMGDAEFTRILRDVQTNPASMTQYMSNPKFQLLLEVALGMKMSSPGAAGMGGDEDMPFDFGADSAAERAAEPVQSKPPPPPEPEPEVNNEVKMKAAKKAEAQKAKEAGNEAYKARRFPEAIAHYNQALELYDEDISFLTNRAAVYYESGQFDECIADCDKAVERGRELRADFKLVAKALARKASALIKLDRYEDAILQFNKSLTEHRSADTLKKLLDCERALKDRKEAAYISMDLCNEEREKGNAFFKQMKYPEAVAAYAEALKRGPPSVNPEAHKLFSNLATCYTKLGAYPDGVKAADKCIELEPSFAKGYSRKGTLQFLMKEYEKAMETFGAGLKHEPDNEELLEGSNKCVDAISRFASGQASTEEIKDRQARSMADPEIQNILKDPVMMQVLRDFQEDAKGSQHHLKSPEVMAKINKLVAAGIIQVK